MKIRGPGTDNRDILPESADLIDSLRAHEKSS